MEPMPPPSISVLIPAYNAGRYVGECLDSVLSQEGADFEVVCVDDGSTDGTAEVLARYAAADPRIRVFRQENAGVAAARNRLLGEARGKWFYFCDADDKLAPGAFARLLEAAEAQDLDALSFGADVFYDPAELEARFPEFKNRYSFERDFSSPVAGRDFFCGCIEENEWKALLWMLFFKSDLVRRGSLRFPDGNWHEDGIFVLELLLRARRVACIPEKGIGAHFVGGRMEGGRHGRQAGGIMGQRADPCNAGIGNQAATGRGSANGRGWTGRGNIYENTKNAASRTRMEGGSMNDGAGKRNAKKRGWTRGEGGCRSRYPGRCGRRGMDFLALDNGAKA